MKKERTIKKYSSIRRNCVNIDDPEFSRRPKEGHGFIYRYHFIKSGKDYIGQTINTIKKRLTTHNKKGTLVDDIIRSGSLFSIDILAEVPTEYLDNAERYCISHFNTMFPAGYNMLQGGQQSRISYSDEIRKKIGKKSRESWKNRDPSAVCKHKERFMSYLHRREEGRLKKCICLETGEIFRTPDDLAIALGVSLNTIKHVLLGYNRTSVFHGRHYIFWSEYIENNREEVIKVMDDWQCIKKDMHIRKLKSVRKRNSKMAMLNGTVPGSIRIRCIDTGEVFVSMSSAARRYDVTSATISRSCSGKRTRLPVSFEKVTV